MPREHLHFVTGRLAEHSLRAVVARLAEQVGFDYTIDVLPITVAALMTPAWIARQLTIAATPSRVIVPGYCEGDLAPIQAAAGVPVERGPRDLRRLDELFGKKSGPPAEYGRHDIEIIAEINHAPRLALGDIVRQARELADDGADLIDVGCDPGEPWSDVGECVRALKAEGHRVSIDSLNPAEISPAVAAGAELVLSVNASNREAAGDWGCEVVAIPDDFATLGGLDETIDLLASTNVPLRIDPVIEPIGCGFAASLGRYLEVRRRYPDAEMLMGIGNLTELTDADSAGINVLLLGFCQELGIRSVLTTQVINWARTSVRECDLARRLVFHAILAGIPPKHIEPKLVTLRDEKVVEFDPAELDNLASQIKDNNYRLFAEGGQLHLVSANLHLAERDPFLLFERLLHPGFGGAADTHQSPKNIDPSHAFYLGYELAKAATALALSKQYRQDEALDWGYLTVPEESHRLKKSAVKREAPMSAPPEDLPLAIELRPAPDVEAALVRLASRPHCLLLDSALRDPRLGRYSFLTADPFDYFTVPADGSDGLSLLADKLKRWHSIHRADLPPFQGGAAGLLSYDLARSLEHIAQPRIDEFGLPALAMGLYDVVLAFDHAEHRAWLVAQGFPETEPGRRIARARQRLDQFRAWLTESPAPVPRRLNAPVISAAEFASRHGVPGPPGLSSNFSAAGYQAAVQRAIDYIHAGDVFQVNLSQRLLLPAADDALALYLKLRQCNPATFAAWFDGGDDRHGDWQIASASPERFVSVRNGQVEARPIKGTRRRTAWVEADLFAGDELKASEKDRSENIMIVDLLRNDLSRVCRPDSVRVTQLCGLEMYQFVQHLVSAVTGTLRSECSAIDLLRGAFPGGSVTGAPKVRAMEIIAELEPTARGPYCGSIGYLGFDGWLDLSILIRTITSRRGWWQFPVGGGIVAQSDPQSEYEETWHKAAGLLRAMA